MIPVYKPRIFKESALKAIESSWISSQGEYIGKTVELLKTFFKIPYVILMNNGTSSTHMLLKALQFKYPTVKKLYVPNNVFVAVWNVCFYENQFDLEVLEMDPATLNMRVDEEYIQSFEKGSAVFIVHNVGNIVNVPRLKRLRPDLIFVEDNCEGLFGKYETIYSGMSEDSLCSSCSFFGNKIITSGEGGAFFTHDKEVYDYIYSTIHHGLGTQQFVYDRLGYNYRMTNVQAAFLYDQLLNIESILADKERVIREYKKHLTTDSILFPVEDMYTKGSNWMFVCGIQKPYQEIYDFMRSKNIDIRPFFYDIQMHKHLSSIPRKEFKLETTFIMLPSYPDLSDEEVAFISKTLLSFAQLK